MAESTNKCFKCGAPLSGLSSITGICMKCAINSCLGFMPALVVILLFSLELSAKKEPAESTYTCDQLEEYQNITKEYQASPTSITYQGFRYKVFDIENNAVIFVLKEDCNFEAVFLPVYDYEIN